jgi:HSP20 family protein
MKEKETEPAVTTPSKMLVEAEKNEAFIENPFFVEAEKMFDKLAEISRLTAHKAYDFFLERGGGFGREIDDWFNAEKEILRFVPVQVAESNGTVRVRADIAGFKPEEVEISIKDDVLMISGKTEASLEKNDENVVYSDFKSNQFFRKMTLPMPVDADKAIAEIKDGMLNISLPKSAASTEPKRIAVKAAT